MKSSISSPLGLRRAFLWHRFWQEELESGSHTGGFVLFTWTNHHLQKVAHVPRRTRDQGTHFRFTKIRSCAPRPIFSRPCRKRWKTQGRKEGPIFEKFDAVLRCSNFTKVRSNFYHNHMSNNMDFGSINSFSDFRIFSIVHVFLTPKKAPKPRQKAQFWDTMFRNWPPKPPKGAHSDRKRRPKRDPFRVSDEAEGPGLASHPVRVFLTSPSFFSSWKELQTLLLPMKNDSSQ